MKRLSAAVLLMVCLGDAARAAEGALVLDVYTLPMEGMHEVHSILTNTGDVPLTVPTRSYTGYPDASGTGNGKVSYYFLIGFGDLGAKKLVPSPERFFPVTLQPGEATELPMIQSKVPGTNVIKIVYVVDEDYASRHGWWHGKLVKSVVPGQEEDNPYLSKLEPQDPVQPPPPPAEPGNTEAQPGATDNPDDAQRLREDH